MKRAVFASAIQLRHSAILPSLTRVFFNFAQPPSQAMQSFPKSAAAVPVAQVLPLAAKSWPAAWPFSPHDFARLDEASDARFYDVPRFCLHIDARAAASLTQYYAAAFREWPRPSILDLCASHVSHFPSDVASFTGRRVALGMNARELSSNAQVDSFVVKDLNSDPMLPFDDNSFDVVTCAVSIDYINKPLAVCNEIARVLKPGGAAIFALSNRCFPSKAVNIWLHTNDLEHVYVVGAYFHYAGKFKPACASEISPEQQQGAALWRGGASQNDAYLSVVKAIVDK